ncbi:MAG TPA: inner membrane CreD family protein, partial [Saprospiraceae bacterium]|nr:inner membrane CreD family protein [Saprospiraceae bacterium]
SESYLVLGINDLKGIENKVDLSWNSTVLKLKPGTRDISFNQNPFLNPTHDASPIIHESYTGKSGLNTKVNIPNLNDEFSFSMNLNIKGSKQLLFTPFGEDTEVSLSSKYADPIFTGHFLPTHNTHSAGFDAQWKILEYNKILPSYQKGDDFVNAGKNVFGVEIKNLVDHYTKINRAAKYMFLVVVLVFLVVFITEL